MPTCFIRLLFPRSAERGSIEAVSSRAASCLRVPRFHAQLSVAPLKPRDARRQPNARQPEFPRSAERGSIEANVVEQSAAALQVFPRSAERGSIEATSGKRGTQRPWLVSTLS